VDPEILTIDDAAMQIARKRRLGYGDSSRQRYDILHRQSHLGPSLNLPAILSMRNDVTQILPSPIRDMLIARR
jgi:hypothetical protein